MLSVSPLKLYLIFEAVLPLQRVDDILQFIADFTVDIEGVGHVCRLLCQLIYTILL